MQTRYKNLFNTIIIPVMVITDIFLIASYWDQNNQQTRYGVLAVLFLIGFNLIQCVFKSIPTPWGPLETRSETLDVIRWCVNLSTSMYIIWCLNIDEPAVAAFFLLLLTFGAMTEVYRQKHKLVTVGMAFVCFCILFYGIYPLAIEDRIYMTACYLGLVFFIWKLERLMIGEITQFILEQKERRSVEKESEGLQRDAAIGHSTKAINHELNTLIGVANLSAFQIETNHNAHNDIEQEMKRLDRTLSHMNRVSSLVLDGLGNKKAKVHTISLQELESDLRLLISTNNRVCKTQLTINFPEKSEDYFFEERSGSTFLIIHNLVKNAFEAVDEVHMGRCTGKVDVDVTVLDDKFVISVEDNGIGMSELKIVNIKQQLATTTKLEGHGLGLKFVQSECIKNNMILDISSKIDTFSVFKITVPLIQR
ncbi:ATP-binding protein [Leucothrix arctica]|uniref:histidine kinase n=1 Tax=Leucothrix arctica TaxID=1481894 RepID=A0A317C5J1_9GAMM|nr:ATP-binding protein [Leucothrix arctica]PWQ93577.1 hypothetical protein DKT75_18330 [Leucothrix arctica]